MQDHFVLFYKIKQTGGFRHEEERLRMVPFRRNGRQAEIFQGNVLTNREVYVSISIYK